MGVPGVRPLRQVHPTRQAEMKYHPCSCRCWGPVGGGHFWTLLQWPTPAGGGGLHNGVAGGDVKDQPQGKGHHRLAGHRGRQPIWVAEGLGHRQWAPVHQPGVLGLSGEGMISTTSQRLSTIQQKMDWWNGSIGL